MNIIIRQSEEHTRKLREVLEELERRGVHKTKSDLLRDKIDEIKLFVFDKQDDLF